ncbi:hypothetical protein ABZU76_45995 [Amycolatopsis sp. NPDC005232]|uniref:hypothetical protein n=1 Tax=Amycolatopsis sp. NPDC005232 TaxID=3157027 RepID=UPI0033A78F5D
MRRHSGSRQPWDPAATHHWLFEGSQWLADQLGVSVVETPGGHIPQLTHAAAYVTMLRPTFAGFGM